jgi:hypothetical protein
MVLSYDVVFATIFQVMHFMYLHVSCMRKESMLLSRLLTFMMVTKCNMHFTS